MLCCDVSIPNIRNVEKKTSWIKLDLFYIIIYEINVIYNLLNHPNEIHLYVIFQGCNFPHTLFYEAFFHLVSKFIRINGRKINQKLSSTYRPHSNYKNFQNQPILISFVILFCSHYQLHHPSKLYDNLYGYCIWQNL